MTGRKTRKKEVLKMKEYYVNENGIVIFKDTESNAFYQIDVDGVTIGESIELDEAIAIAQDTKVI